MSQCIAQTLSFDDADENLIFASTRHALPVIIDTKDAEAIRIAVNTFADDVSRVVNIRPVVTESKVWTQPVIIACTVDSELCRSISGIAEVRAGLTGKWEAFDVRVVKTPWNGVAEALLILGSDRVRFLR